MAKPEPALLDPSRYPYSCPLEVRFSDLDINCHVNNAALAEILQEARVRFHFASRFHEAVEGMTSMAVSFSVDYLGQARHPDPLDSYTAALAIGRTSHTVGQLLLQNGAPVAFARTVIVCVLNDQPAPNPPEFVERIQEWMIRS